MIVPAPEIELMLTARKLRRRVMRLPRIGRQRSPVREGRAYKLQPERFVRARATITVVSLADGWLDELELSDARAEGYERLEDALAAWARWHGPPARPRQRVWVVGFVLGNQEGDR